MPSRFLSRLSLRWFPLLCMALLIVGLPVGCAALQHKERELVFRIEPGQASWFRGLPAGVQIFSLFDANPQLVDLIVDIAATAPQLAAYLSRHSSVLDAVLGERRMMADVLADPARLKSSGAMGETKK